MNSITIIYTTLLVVSIFFLVINAVMQIRIKQVTDLTHTIVNSQRSMMLRAISLLSRRIADENPLDDKAQTAASAADKDAEDANEARR